MPMAMVPAYFKATSAVRNKILVVTNVAYKYMPTASVSVTASYQRQDRKPKSDGITMWIVTHTPYGLALAAVYKLRWFKLATVT